jgi:hypothetical protein
MDMTVTVASHGFVLIRVGRLVMLAPAFWNLGITWSTPPSVPICSLGLSVAERWASSIVRATA